MMFAGRIAVRIGRWLRRGGFLGLRIGGAGGIAIHDGAQIHDDQGARLLGRGSRLGEEVEVVVTAGVDRDEVCRCCGHTPFHNTEEEFDVESMGSREE